MVTGQESSQSPVQVEDHKPAATDTIQKEKDAMPYVETSQFRRNSPSSNAILTKTLAGKYAGIIKKEIPTEKKETKLKNSFLRVSGKKLLKQAQETKLPVTTAKEEKKQEAIVIDPPAPYQLPFNDEIFSSFRALPSNEEYDRNNRYQHSFLYGYGPF